MPLFSNDWKDRFALSNRMRKGLLFLFVILATEIIVLLYLHFTPSKISELKIENLQIAVDRLAKKDSLIVNEESSSGSTSNIEDNEEAVLFPFNPNKLPVEDWSRLGFSENQIKVIKNYEAKGGKFFSKADVRKIFSISAEDFQRIEPFIAIPDRSKDSVDTGTNNKKKPAFSKTNAELIIDINSADTMELQKLRGIGPVKARTISNYRAKLGGFHSINQLREVWGINDSLFESLKPHLRLKDFINLKKINLNSMDISTLKHPYISYNLAKIILNFHKQHGAFIAIEDLKKVPLVSDSLYLKIAPYLEIKN